MSNRLVIGVRGRIQPGINGLQIKLSTNFTFTAENPYNPPLYSMPSDELNLVRQSQFSKTRQKQRTTAIKLHFSSVGKHAIKWLPAADRNHVNTSCGDTIKCLLDAGKSPIFRSQSPCTYIWVVLRKCVPMCDMKQSPESRDESGGFGRKCYKIDHSGANHQKRSSQTGSKATLTITYCNSS